MRFQLPNSTALLAHHLWDHQTFFQKKSANYVSLLRVKGQQIQCLGPAPTAMRLPLAVFGTLARNGCPTQFILPMQYAVRSGFDAFLEERSGQTTWRDNKSYIETSRIFKRHIFRWCGGRGGGKSSWICFRRHFCSQVYVVHSSMSLLTPWQFPTHVASIFISFASSCLPSHDYEVYRHKTFQRTRWFQFHVHTCFQIVNVCFFHI